MYRSEHSRETVTVDEAIRRILVDCPVLPPRSVSLLDARGLVLAEQVFASTDSPRFDTVAMDGYAIQAADVRGASPDRPARLGVVGSVAAGSSLDVAVAPGTAIRVMTGAVLPTDADAVIPFESVEEGPDQISVLEPLVSGANVRRAGEDVTGGQLLLEPGLTLQAAQLALIAAEGMSAVDVHLRPRVAVIATGDELVAPGQALDPGQIWDSNSVMVAVLIEQFGGEIATCTHTGDEPDQVLSLVRGEVAAGADLIVTIGGAARGDRDVLSEVETDGAKLDFWDVRMKPGRPLVVGSVDGVPLIGLPGNPAAAFVSAVQFVRPAVVTMSGRLDVDPPTILARVDVEIMNPGGKRAYIRVQIDHRDSGVVTRPAGPQNVANLATLARADGLLVIPEVVDRVEPGTALPVQLIRDL